MDKTTELFCLIDDFCQQFEPLREQRMLGESADIQRRQACEMSLSEMTTIVVLFHATRGRQFKAFYRGTVCCFHDLGGSPPTVLHAFRGLDAALRHSVGRIVPDAQGGLHGHLHCRFNAAGRLPFAVCRLPFAVCHNLRIQRHRVFQGIAQRGKSSTGWFYGFKLHAVINQWGEIVAIKVTAGNVDDRKGLLAIASSLFGTLYADKGYIGKEFAQKMKDKGLDVVMRVRKNMKEVLHSEFDQALLRKRSLVETVFDERKNLCQIEHTRHRSPPNFAVN